MEVSLPKMQFATWFKDTSLEINGDTASIIVANSFSKSWLQNHHAKDILEAIQKQEKSVSSLEFTVKKQDQTQRMTLELSPKKAPKSPAETPPVPAKAVIQPTLNASYTFDNFIVGNNSALAYAVAKEAATHPGKKHNPLFIYGGVGLGKTHLAQAVGHEILGKDSSKKIVYVSCETFTNDFIAAIAGKKMSQFKKNYRDADVLIVDDIQFLSAKEGSQEEFFHTYNTLHQNSRQIILTADKIPQAIPALEPRLQSRFGAGIVVDLQPPNLETRIAILQEKSKEKKVVFPDNVLEHLAKNISSNIRELEGALNRLATFCEFNCVSPSISIVNSALGDFISSNNRTVDSSKIISCVCKYYSIGKDDLLGRARKKELVLPRQIAIFLIREQTNKSLPEIGKIFGGKDHTTILHAQKKIESSVLIDSSLKSDIEQIRQNVLSIN
ncbi:MAG: Chromosomal replication initiator protein DnaA [candidate division WS2 bacterium ADurb.Bin280]|uniref:Chromosomal replication initiator protein DnaA n=1 Tax=candidate division WS2 bacterium ADurb.Bin280 TaxID=1852829 RepID=A0A1V5SF73_9BACT|nr:MAG: Chromosomal replication initiator protein DnaA [candidate division WS2 bacterium ADurb.Bin280]